MTRWKYLLVLVALVSWLANLLLDYVSGITDWFWYLSLACWLVLFLLTWLALFRRRWRELVIVSLTLAVISVPAFGVGAEPIEWLQDKLFRVYALHRIGALPLEEFLSRCKLINYVEDDGAKGTIGQCNEGFWSTKWFLFSVIYDPTGQFARPGYRRTTAWRLAVDEGFLAGSVIKKTDDGKHLIGNFYYVKIYQDL